MPDSSFLCPNRMCRLADITISCVSRSSRILIKFYFLWELQIFSPGKITNQYLLSENIKVISGGWTKKSSAAFIAVQIRTEAWRMLTWTFIKTSKLRKFWCLQNWSCKSGGKELSCKISRALCCLVEMKVLCAWPFSAFSEFWVSLKWDENLWKYRDFKSQKLTFQSIHKWLLENLFCNPCMALLWSLFWRNDPLPTIH